MTVSSFSHAPSGHQRWWSVASLVMVIVISATGQAQRPISPSLVPITNQDSALPPLTIAEAVALAERNNPVYLRTVANQRSAVAALQSARGAFLPRLSASLAGQYQQGGQQLIDGYALGAGSDVLQSNYNLGLTYTLNGTTLLGPKQEHAALDAADADIVDARETLRATVQQQYWTVLQSNARAVLQDTLVENARVQLKLVQGRASVGSGTQLDVQRAEVALRQQQVQQLQAKNQAEVDQVRLFQQIGIPSKRVILTSTVAANLPVPSLDSLIAMSQRQNASVRASRFRERAADVGVARARMEYTPTASLSTGIGGYTYQYRDPNFLINQASAQLTAERESCLQTEEVLAALSFPNSLSQCASFTLTNAQAAQIRAQNAKFPFDFTKTPYSITASLTLPLFDGFMREQHVQDASVQRDNARYSRRERELALTADVTAAYLTLQTAQQTVSLQTQNAAKARQELKFVQDQYSVGIATFVDLTTSRTAYAQAESDLITASYDYQKAFAALESAVGHPFR